VTDKRSETQFDGVMPEGMDFSWTAESQNEQGEEEAKKRHRHRPLSRDAEDIENSKRSRGERL